MYYNNSMYLLQNFPLSWPLVSFDSEVIDRYIVKYLIIFYILIYVQYLQAKPCSEYSQEDMQDLIKKSPYTVNSIDCRNGVFVWDISNRKYFNHKTTRLKNTNSRKLASVDGESEHVKVQMFYASISGASALISQTDSLTNVTETAASDLGLGISMIWSHKWSQRFEIYAVGSFKSFRFKVDTSRTLKNPNMTQAYMGFGGKYKFDRASIGVGIGQGESIMLSSNGTGEITLEKIAIPTVSVDTTTRLFQSENKFNLNLNLRYGQMLSADRAGYKVESGRYYSIGLSSTREFFGRKYNLGFNYTDRKIELDSSDQDAKEVSLTVGSGWSF